MRLRYFHLEDLPPLDDLTVTFQRAPVLMNRPSDCTIHFLVGVNGVGKTRFLQNLTHVLLAFERQERPSFPATLVYDLGTGDQTRTIYLHFPSKREGEPLGEPIVIEFAGEAQFQTLAEETAYWTSLGQFDWNPTRALANGLPPEMQDLTVKVENVYRGLLSLGSGSIPDLMPFLLTYTSGATRGWDQIFAPRLVGMNDFSFELSQMDTSEELPANWDVRQEMQAAFELGDIQEERITALLNDPKAADETERFQSKRGIFVGNEELPLAVCAVVLHQASQELAGQDRQNERAQQAYINRIQEALSTGTPMDGLRGVLNEIRWLWPVTIRLEMTDTPDFDEDQTDDWRHAVTQALRRPGPQQTGKNFIFDVHTFPVDKTSTAGALANAIGGKDGTAFTIFRQLLAWQRQGLLRELSMTFRRLDDDDLLLYDWLSDGERMLLGRVALFYLLAGAGSTDTLLILDEPETHFNDLWKRQIVDMLFQSLGKTATDALISTHSSIELSDLFAEQIERLRKRDGKTVSDQITSPTFGADPSEIMVTVFEAPDSIGQQALEYLEDRVRHAWLPEEKAQLAELIRRIGAGYHRSELRAIWKALPEFNVTSR